MKDTGYRAAKVALIIAAAAVAVIPLLSQTPETKKKPSFDVTSVKPTPPSQFGFRGGGPRGNRFTMTGTLRMMLQFAYRPLNSQPGVPAPPLMNSQIIGGPGWMDSDLYDIQATAETNTGTIPQDQMQLMLQSLLEDRFQLKAHLETRELPIYNLVVGKDGPKIKLSEDQTPVIAPSGPPRGGPAIATERGAGPRGEPGPGQRGFSFDARGPVPRGAFFFMPSPSGLTLTASAMPVSILVNVLSGQVGRPVIDKTDLKGLYDFKLTYSPEGLTSPFGGGPLGGGLAGGPGPAAGPQTTLASDPAASLFTAIQELGLRLESTKSPIDVLVIESVQKPEEN
jgi:uncharacterized protein (TIGR03435 family)